jgi:hypothetical protein
MTGVEVEPVAPAVTGAQEVRRSAINRIKPMMSLRVALLVEWVESFSRPYRNQRHEAISSYIGD